MKKAKKYLGRKILIIYEDKESNYYKEETINTLCSLEEYKKSIELKWKDFAKIKLIEDNIELYKCKEFKTNRLDKLAEIRNNIKNKKLKYDIYLTKNEIIEKLNNDYIICIQGFKEIDLDNIDIL